MKLLTLIFTASFFFAPTLLANIDSFFDPERGLIGNRKVMNFSGVGSYYHKPDDKRGKYKVLLKATNLGKDKLHLYWDISFDGKKELYSIVVERDHELITVYSPTDAENLRDLDTYKIAGWGYSGVVGTGLKRKILVFLNYQYVDGNRYDEHFAIQLNRDGKLVVDSSGTIGNDKDGMIEMWQDQVKQLDD